MEPVETVSRIAVLETKVENIAEKLETIRTEQKEQHVFLCEKFDNVSKRIAVLEKWRWMIFGGAIVVGYILAHVKIENIF
jgi:hypothetical protein